MVLNWSRNKMFIRFLQYAVSVRLVTWRQAVPSQLRVPLPQPARRVRLFALAFLCAFPLPGQSSGADPANPSPQPQSSEDKRILGVIPNFYTVSDPRRPFSPLTVKRKFELFAKETFDPFTLASAAAGAGLSQAGNDHPKYGQGTGPYFQRFGAAAADVASQNFFSDAVLASLLREDPRYFRKGPQFGFWNRLGYAMSRVVITRTDSGKRTFNYSGILGMSMGIGLSNAYYPDASVNGRVVAERFGTSLAAASLSNILPEFWPDIRQKLTRHKPHP
jgi:hypothetical protein